MNITNGIKTTGFYGGSKTPCTIFAAKERNGLTWYAVEGSLNVNATFEDIKEGCNVETIDDVDAITSGNPIESISDLLNTVNE